MVLRHRNGFINWVDVEGGKLTRPKRNTKADVSSVSQAFDRTNRRSSDGGLMLETSAFKFLYGGQFTISTRLINPFLSPSY